MAYRNPEYPALANWTEENRISGAKLARLLFISNTTVYSRLKGFSDWRFEEALKIEEMSGIPMKEILRRKQK